MLISLAIAILLSTIKNPKNKARLRERMREVRDAINAAYLNDPEF